MDGRKLFIVSDSCHLLCLVHMESKKCPKPSNSLKKSGLWAKSETNLSVLGTTLALCVWVCLHTWANKTRVICPNSSGVTSYGSRIWANKGGLFAQVNAPVCTLANKLPFICVNLDWFTSYGSKTCSGYFIWANSDSVTSWKFEQINSIYLLHVYGALRGFGPCTHEQMKYRLFAQILTDKLLMPRAHGANESNLLKFPIRKRIRLCSNKWWFIFSCEQGFTDPKFAQINGALFAHVCTAFSSHSS